MILWHSPSQGFPVANWRIRFHLEKAKETVRNLLHLTLAAEKKRGKQGEQNETKA